MIWEVYALRYATHARKAQDNFLRPVDPHDAPMPLDYFVWLLRSGSQTILVDTGFAPAVSAARGRTLLRPVPDALRAMDVDPAALTDVIITHLHYDHAGNLDQFPAARLHLQDRELAFATGRHMCFACMRHSFEVEDVVAMVRAVYADRVIFFDGDGEVAPGVTLHRVGGHTDGLQMVRVETGRGPIVLASDAAHFYGNLERENPFPIVFDLGAMAQGWRRAGGWRTGTKRGSCRGMIRWCGPGIRRSRAATGRWCACICRRARRAAGEGKGLCLGSHSNWPTRASRNLWLLRPLTPFKAGP